jgi:hypothetical protein
VIGDCNHFDMQRVSYDRMFAGQMVQELDEETPRRRDRPGRADLRRPLARLQGARAAARRAGVPARRQPGPAVDGLGGRGPNDGADNIRPVKPDRKQSTTRIDGIQAAVTALDGIVRAPEVAKKLTRVTGTRIRLLMGDRVPD